MQPWGWSVSRRVATPSYRGQQTENALRERIQWSQSEIRDYNEACRLRQPSGVKPEEAELYCACKTVGLSTNFRSPTSAEASRAPTEYERERYLRTGEIPWDSEAARYGEVVITCRKTVRQKYGIPEVSLEE